MGNNGGISRESHGRDQLVVQLVVQRRHADELGGEGKRNEEWFPGVS